MKVLKIDKLTWRVVDSYPGVAAAARANGVEVYVVGNMVYQRSMPAGRWVYRAEGDYDPADGVPTEGRNAVVDFEDTLTGRRMRATSASALAEKVGCSLKAVYDARRQGTRLRGRFLVPKGGFE